MTTVGDEIWVGEADGPGIFRIPLSGAPPSLVGTLLTNPIGGMTTVGNEIWVGSAVDPEIFRLDPFGNLLGPVLPPFTPLPFPIGGMTTVGNEVWVGSAEGSEVLRLDLNGTTLGTFFTPINQAGGMASVVPIPPAVWLFGSGLLGLIGIARRKKVS